MVLYYLSQNSELLDKTREECQKVFNISNKLGPQELQGLEYTEAILKETMRMAPSGPVLMIRKATTDHFIWDISVKKGTGVTIPFIVNMFNQGIFPNPEKFDPYRWLNKGNEGKSTQPDHFAYFLFSAGPRNWIGQHVAMLEAKILIGWFLMKYEYEVPKGYKLKITIKFVYDPVDPLNIEVCRR